MAGRHMAAVALLLALAGCEGRSDNGGAAGGSASGVTAPSVRRADASTCRAIEPVGTNDRTRDREATIEEGQAALRAAPAEIEQPIRDLFERQQQAATDPSTDPLTRGAAWLSAGVRSSHAVRDWYRRSCGPETATSPYCETFARSTAEYDLGMVSTMVADGATDDPGQGLGALLGSMMVHGAVRLRAILPVAPPEVAPSVQLLIDHRGRYGGPGGTAPPPGSAPAQAELAIPGSLRDECGIALRFLEW